MYFSLFMFLSISLYSASSHQFKNMTAQDMMSKYCGSIMIDFGTTRQKISQRDFLKEVRSIIETTPQHLDEFIQFFNKERTVEKIIVHMKAAKITKIIMLKNLLEKFDLSEMQQAMTLLTIDKLQTTVDDKLIRKHFRNLNAPIEDALADQKEKSILGTYLASSYGVWGEFLVALKIGDVDYFEVTLADVLSNKHKNILKRNGLEKALNYELDIVYGHHFVEVKYLTNFFELGDKETAKLLTKMSTLAKAAKVLESEKNKIVFELALEGPGSLRESTRYLIESAEIRVYENNYTPNQKSLEKARKNRFFNLY